MQTQMSSSKMFVLFALMLVQNQPPASICFQIASEDNTHL